VKTVFELGLFDRGNDFFVIGARFAASCRTKQDFAQDFSRFQAEPGTREIAPNQTFTLTTIQFTNAGLYSVVVSSALGSVTNTPAQVVVNTAGVSLGLYPGVTVSGLVGYTYLIQANTD